MFSRMGGERTSKMYLKTMNKVQCSVIGIVLYLTKHEPMENTNTPPQDPQQDDVTRGKTVGILSYCTLIGWIVGMVLHQQDKTKFGAFHLRQSLGILIAYLACFIVITITLPFLGFLTFALYPIVGLGVLVLLILGLINAVNGKMTEAPLIGKLSEKFLAGIK